MRKCYCLLLAVLLLAGCSQTHTHDYGAWTTVKPAECTGEGLQERVCACGERQTQSLAVAGHDLDDLGACAVCGFQEAETPSGPVTTGTNVKAAEHKFTVGKIAFTTGLKEKVGETVYSKGEGHMLVIQLTFTNLEGSKKSVQVGDTVRFQYDYVSQVSELLGLPHISVNKIRVN